MQCKILITLFLLMSQDYFLIKTDEKDFVEKIKILKQIDSVKYQQIDSIEILTSITVESIYKLINKNIFLIEKIAGYPAEKPHVILSVYVIKHDKLKLIGRVNIDRDKGKFLNCDVRFYLYGNDLLITDYDLL